MFDAIVIGSGMSGGIAAKELTERGLKVLVLERGGDVQPADQTDWMQPWQLPTAGMVPEEELARDYPIDVPAGTDVVTWPSSALWTT